MWKIFTQYTHFLSVIQNDLSWLNNLFMVNFQLSSMSSYAQKNNRCVESLNNSVEVAKCGKYSQIHPVHSLLQLQKWLVLPEQSIHGKVSTH